MSSPDALLADEPLIGPAARRSMFRWGLALVAAALGWSCLVFVDETEFVIVETFGRVSAVYDEVSEEKSDRGLHFKWPWPVGMARRFDRRLQVFDPPGREMFTGDKKNIVVSSYLCWRIAPGAGEPFDQRPVVRYFRGLGDAATAEARLDARLRSLIAGEFARIELASLLTATSAEAGPDDLESRFGVKVVDLGIHRLNFPEGNRFAVYERMRTERERMAERYRATGRAEKARIESQAKRQADEILAKAEAEAARIRGEGEAEALAILHKAWERDPEFYEFQRTLSAYSKILDKRTTLVLSTAGKLLRVLQEGPPEAGRDKSPEARPSPPAGAQAAP
jgi:membrane protease subunit HflC